MSREDSAAKRKPFKDWFDRAAARALAAQVARVRPGFDQTGFVRSASRNLKQLEFGARVQQFSDALARSLPPAPASLKVLTKSLPAPLPDCEAVTDGWLQWPIGQYIADHGLPHFEESMRAMVELTQRFSSEFAVRPFVEHQSEETFERLLSLTRNSSPHVRRWCSEGTRPRLPWGKKLRALVADPSPIWPILEALKDDPELYVRKSVANNLNDIAKDHPEWVVRRMRAWARGKSEPRGWVIRHGLRSLVKAGHPGALATIGYGPPQRLSASLSIRRGRVAIGGQVELVAELKTAATRRQQLVVDYAVHYVRQGKAATAKVFKWTTAELPARGTLSLQKSHRMHVTSIRALYPGVHRVELQVNGQRLAQASFRLG